MESAALPAVAVEDDYKKLREAFVSDHYGSSVWDINKVALVAPIAVLLWSILQARQKFFDPYTPLGLFVDFLLQCCAILFATTVYSNSSAVLLGLLFVPAISLYLNHKPHSDNKKVPKKPPTADGAGEKESNDQPIDTLPVRPFVTHYRAVMLIATCVCILAVDFPVFPRRFAKTESLGTSLMDLGVGSFVFSSGVVSVRGQLKEEDGDSPRTSFIRRFITSFRHAIPLLALGFIRLYTVKKLDYAEHVTEYGVHWNFFFTLATIPPFVAIFQSIFRLVPSYAILGYLVSLVQETSLNMTGLLQWVVFADRGESLLNANKEGVVSIPGYLAIYLSGQAIGMAILRRDQDPQASETENDLWLAQTLGGDEAVQKTRKAQRQFAWINLAKYSAIWCVAYWVHTGYRGPRLVVSRRFANMAYFIWVSAFNTVLLFIYCTIEMALFPDVYNARTKKAETDRVKKATSKVLSAFNRNGLALFLVANLLTGGINMSMKTITMGDVPAMGVLTGYMAVLTVVALGLDHAGITIKL